MKLRWFLLAMILLPVLLGACSDDETTLSFSNETECGTATIVLTNTESGNDSEYTLDEGREIKIDVEPVVPYRYSIEYAGRPGSDLDCEPKSGTVMVPERGQSASFALESATPTPGPSSD